MNLVGLSLVKDEQDFIERFVRLNLSALDKLYIVDDCSNDSTLSILNQLQEEGLKITILSLADRRLRLTYEQGKIMTKLMQYALTDCNGKVDYFFPLDADEIIGARRSDLESNILKIPAKHYGLIQWKTFIPKDNSFSPSNYLKDSFTCLQWETKHIYKVVIPGHLAYNVKILTGSHSILSRQEKYLPFILDEIRLFHFPVRDMNQILAKSLVADHKTSLKSIGPTRENYHARQIAILLRENCFQSTPELLHIAIAQYIDIETVPACPNDSGLEKIVDILPMYSRSVSSTSALMALDSLLLDYTNSFYSRLLAKVFRLESKLLNLINLVLPQVSGKYFKLR